VPSGEWQQAWFRTYTPKPARAVKYSRELTQIMQDKFKPMAAGPDVHTAVSPYSRVDYDARMPGAGTMMSQFYSYGQILHEQQQIWDGPVYSECGNNYYYAGLTTGSGALDRTYNVLKQPLLVDFYLRKMQPISGHWSLGYDRTDIRSDGFYARTIAFGMPCGFMGGWRSEMDKYMVRGYYLLQQLQSSYCKALIKDIRYANAKGELLQTSEAIATGAIKRSQIRLEYDNGLMVWVNGHQKDMWETPDSVLPPFGFYATDSKGELVVFSAMKEGRRADYVRSEIYDFVDGRGEWVETRYGACDGQLIVLKKEDGSREVIPYEATKFAVAIDKMPVSVVALDIDGKQIGQTNGLFKNRLYNINEVKGAVSYLLKF